MSITDPKFGWQHFGYEEFIYAEIGKAPGNTLMDAYPPDFFERIDWTYHVRKPQKFMSVHFKVHFVSRGTFFPKKKLASNGIFERRVIAVFDTVALQDSDLPNGEFVADTAFYKFRKGCKVLSPAFLKLMTRSYGYDIE